MTTAAQVMMGLKMIIIGIPSLKNVQEEVYYHDDDVVMFR